MISKNPLISVVLSVFNSKSTINRCIESILNQTLKDFEFIIINDFSNDGSEEIISKLSLKDNRIKVINNPKNIGLTKSLIFGLKISKGKFIARIDSDEYSKPTRLEKQYDFMNKKNIILSGSKCINIYRKERKITKWKYYNDIQIKNNINIRTPFPHGSAMFSSKIYFKCGGYNPDYMTSQDFDLWNKFIKLGNISMLNENLLYRYIEKDSITTQKKFNQFLDSTSIRLNYTKVHNYPYLMFFTFLSIFIAYLPSKVFLLLKRLIR